MNFRTFAAAICMAVFSGSAGGAATVSLGFPSSDSVLHTGGTLGLGGVGAYFSAGSSLTKTFAMTGLGSAVSSTWDFSMYNSLHVSATAMFDVLINGNVVDSFSFMGDSGTVENITLANSFGPIAGDSFTLSIVATNSIFGGGGSWNWLPGGSVILSDGVAPAVPLPAGGLLLLSGLAGIVSLKRRKKHAV